MRRRTVFKISSPDFSARSKDTLPEGFWRTASAPRRLASIALLDPVPATDDSTRQLLRWLVESRRQPLVIDADGLNALAPWPQELRGSDGWHWVQEPVNTLVLARWHRAESPGVEPLWTSTHHVYSGTPRYAAHVWNWRYVAPVTPPAGVAITAPPLQ